jgi:hypothetical protein
MKYSGSCHCGDIAFEVDGNVEKVFECNCSHCSRKGYLLWFVSSEALKITAKEASDGIYLFNKHAIAHHFCKNCGCAPYGISTAAEGKAAVNVRCLESLDLAAVERVAVDGRGFCFEWWAGMG